MNMNNDFWQVKHCYLDRRGFCVMCEGDVGLYDGSQVDILETVDALRDVGSGRLNRNIFVPVNYEIP